MIARPPRHQCGEVDQLVPRSLLLPPITMSITLFDLKMVKQVFISCLFLICGGICSHFAMHVGSDLGNRDDPNYWVFVLFTATKA